jgi:hypothetical protein
LATQTAYGTKNPRGPRQLQENVDLESSPCEEFPVLETKHPLTKIHTPATSDVYGRYSVGSSRFGGIR